MKNTSPLNVVDLFSGCGGLSLGFDAYRTTKGERAFETILAMDNWKPAVEIFRRNHPIRPGAKVASGRVADLSWFDHPSEALLYYLAHYSIATPDDGLSRELYKIGFHRFLAGLRDIDTKFYADLERHASSSEHSSAFAEMDSKVFSLALCKSILGKLHLSSLRDSGLDLQSLPWASEYDQFELPKSGEQEDSDEESVRNANVLWEQTVAQADKAANSKGRGQHAGNAARMATLDSYFNSAAGLDLKALWTNWYASRITLRSQFCLKAYSDLKKLYSGERRVALLLGGPPCKGFSRIGRAVIRELRDQGAHAWSCNKFGDERNSLMYHYVVFLEALQPQIFLFENVSNFASKLKTPDGDLDAPQLLEELIDSLECDGLTYEIDARIVRAKEHAIPQARERYIMCGVSSRVGSVPPGSILAIHKYDAEVALGEVLVGLPAAKIFKDEVGSSTATVATSEPGEGLTVAASTYLGWIKSVGPDGKDSANADAHIYRKPRQDDANLYRLLAPGIRWMDLKTPASQTLHSLSALLSDVCESVEGVVKYKDIASRAAKMHELLNDSLALRLLLEQASVGLAEPHHLLGEGYLSNGSGQHGDWLERLSATKPCKTIVAHIGKDTYGYVHPFEARPITIREAARIQSFPDWFSFGGVGVVDAYSMIGNAVPPLLARHFASRIAVALGLEPGRLESNSFPSAVTSKRQCVFEFERENKSGSTAL